MSLTDIKYGSLASSSLMNHNFQYLDNKIGDLSSIVTSNQAGLSSNIANINSSINTLQEKTTTEITELKNRNYIKKTYVNGTSGYRIWNDNFCEQWGYNYMNGSIISFLQQFKDTNYNITFSSDSIGFDGQMGHPIVSQKHNKGFQGRYVNSKGTVGSGNAHWCARGYIVIEENSDGV